jgi:hypothetical protein
MIAARKTMTVTLDTRVVAGTGQVSTQLGNETVILGGAKGMYFGLNTVGARVWELLTKPTDVRSIVAVIVSEYDAPEQAITDDVLKLIADFVEHGLVVTGANIRE